MHAPLKIVLLGEQTFEQNGFHIAESLRFLGHNVTIIPLNEGLPWYLKTSATKKLNYYLFKGSQLLEIKYAESLGKKIEAIEPDLLINLYRTIHPSLVPKLRRSLPKTKFVHINSDAISNYEGQQLFISEYDFYFVKDPYILNFFSNFLGCNAYLLSEYCNPRIVKKPLMLKQELEKEVNLDVSIYGGMYPYRARFIEYFLDNNMEINAFGYLGKYVSDKVKNCYNKEYLIGERKAKIIYGTKVFLNNFHYAEIEGVNQKFFEIFGAGGCQICTYKDIIKTYSPVDPELFTFKNNKEALEKVNFYLKNDDKRFELSEIMHKHFIENHTIDHRMNEVLNKVYSED